MWIIRYFNKNVLSISTLTVTLSLVDAPKLDVISSALTTFPAGTSIVQVQ